MKVIGKVNTGVIAVLETIEDGSARKNSEPPKKNFNHGKR